MTAVAGTTHVERLGASAVPALRDFLGQRADAHVFHSPEWLDVIRDAYGHRCDYWVARSGNTIVGAFPVLVVNVPLLGTKMIALAYQMDTGLPLADTPETAAALMDSAAAEARRTGVKYLEVRSLIAAPELEEHGFSAVDSGLVTTIIALDRLERGSVRRNHRRGIRSAEEQGVTITESRTREDLRRFVQLYVEEGRALGAPQAGRRFFDALHRHASDLYRLYLARVQGVVVGGLVTVGDGRVTYARHAAYSSPAALAHHAGTALYWRAISDAASAGVTHFNCGISWEGDTGLIHWKEGWSGETVPVRLYALGVRGTLHPPGDYLGGYGRMKAVWRRLPLPAAELGGHLVTRWIC
ncbi:MAG TPA: GNAT family N-acetyltransferase [Longimicrobiales bacterium]|nr:GNAT family N-acetyltransferase [Longimicrobiales bacterium]